MSNEEKQSKLVKIKKWVLTHKVISIVIAVVFLFCVIGMPIIFSPSKTEKKYTQAINLFEKQKYEEAEKIFSEIDPYKETKNYILECKYSNAKQLIIKKDYKKAIEIFTALNNFKDSKTLLTETRYKYASDCFSKNDFENAALYYSQCGTHLDSKQKETESNYKAGIKNYDSGKFSKAIEYLEKAKNYLDSSTYLDASKVLNQMQGIWREYNVTDWDCYLILGWQILMYDRWGTLRSNSTKVKFENNTYSCSHYEFKSGKFINTWEFSKTTLSFWRAGTSLPVPKIGMTALEAKETIWGSPTKVNTSTNAYGTSEQWVYIDSHYLYFTNGKLTSIQS